MRSDKTHKSSGFAIRNSREGDQTILAPLFNAHAERFFGPIRLTPESWRAQFRRHSWKAPSLEDAGCCRVAEADGAIIGYAITDYEPMWRKDAAILQELCVIDGADAQALTEALIADAEEIALRRSKAVLILGLSPDDGLIGSAAASRGYSERADDGVFMAVVTDLEGCLREIEAALTRRFSASPLSDWRGAIRIVSGEQSARLALGDGWARVAAARARPAITLTVQPEALPMLLFGRKPVGELYSQDTISLKASDVGQALRLLDILFPTVPVYLPRAQSW